MKKNDREAAMVEDIKLESASQSAKHDGLISWAGLGPEAESSLQWGQSCYFRSTQWRIQLT
jgi:hypothetical protein